MAVDGAANAVLANISLGATLVVADFNAVGTAAAIGRALLAMVAAIAVAAADRATGTSRIATVAETLAACCGSAGYGPNAVTGRPAGRAEPGNEATTSHATFALAVGGYAIVLAIGAAGSADLSHAFAEASRKGKRLQRAERGGNKGQRCG
jgi:hypothetical protein